MRQKGSFATAIADPESIKPSLTDIDERTESGKLVLRNYDHQRSYEIEVTISDQQGTQLFHDRFVLLPGETESISDKISSGTYSITAHSNAAQVRSLETQLDDSLEHTAMIEAGNGIISLTAGI